MLGNGYWNRFKALHKDKIVPKKGEKFELDRVNWTICANFKLVYDNTGLEMTEENVETKYDETT